MALAFEIAQRAHEAPFIEQQHKGLLLVFLISLTALINVLMSTVDLGAFVRDRWYGECRLWRSNGGNADRPQGQNTHIQLTAENETWSFHVASVQPVPRNSIRSVNCGKNNNIWKGQTPTNTVRGAPRR
jgi:hypothetical protein